jgi:hypothetical protein
VPTPFYGEKDIPQMMRELGVPVERRLNGEPFRTYGLRDTADLELLQGEGSTFASRVETLTVLTGALPHLDEAVPLVIDDVDCIIIQTRTEGDGALTTIFFRKA